MKLEPARTTLRWESPHTPLILTLHHLDGVITEVEITGGEEGERQVFQSVYQALKGSPLEELRRHLPGPEEESLLSPYLSMRFFDAHIRGSGGGYYQQRGRSSQDVLCACFGVTLSEVMELCHADPAITQAQITAQTMVGGGCGTCGPSLEQTLREWRGAAPVLDPTLEEAPQRPSETASGEGESGARRMDLCAAIQDYFEERELAAVVKGVVGTHVLVQLEDMSLTAQLHRDLTQEFLPKAAGLDLVFAPLNDQG